MINEYSNTWWNEYLDITPGYTCANCKFADEYVAYWWFPYIDPTCSKGHSCSATKSACADFQLIGRLSR